jgi:hypothetical protein
MMQPGQNGRSGNGPTGLDLSFPKIIAAAHSDDAVRKELGVVMITPHLWIARRNGASFSNAKCVRDSL